MAETKVWHLRQGDGPVHLATEGWGAQSWCGKRSQFRHVVRLGTTDEVTCKGCLKRMEIGKPGARGR